MKLLIYKILLKRISYITNQNVEQLTIFSEYLVQFNLVNNFKSKLFRIKNLDKIPAHESTPELATKPTKQKKSKLKLQQEFMNKIIADEKDIYDEIFKYWNPSFLAKDNLELSKLKMNNQEIILMIN